MRRLTLSVLGAAMALAIWQCAATAMHNPGLFPAIDKIGRAFGLWVVSGLIWTDLGQSLPRALLALIIALPVGVAVGIALALSQTANALLNGPVQLLRSLPPVALLPLFVLWFGIGWDAKVAATAFVCLFPIIVTTMQGASQVEQTYRELARDLELSKWGYVANIVVPGALPSIVPGIRLAAGTSLVMVFVSELAGASSGIGYRISISSLSFQADMMIACLLTLGVIGLLTDVLIAAAGRRWLHYAGR